MDDPREPTALGPEARSELLKRAWTLLAERNYPALRDLLEPLPREELVAEPELGFILAAALRRLGAVPIALELLESLHEQVSRRGDARLARECLNLEGATRFLIGQCAAAEQCFLEMRERAAADGDEVHQATATLNLGIIASVQSQSATALSHFQNFLVWAQRLHMWRGIGNAHHNLGMTYRSLGLYNESDSHFQHAGDLYRLYGSIDELHATESERALLYCDRGDLRLAEVTAERAYGLATTHGLVRSRGESGRVLGIIAFTNGDWSAAEERFAEALQLSRSTMNLLLEAEVLEELAVLASVKGEEAEAERLVGESAALYERIGTRERARRARERLSPVPAGRSPYSDDAE